VVLEAKPTNRNGSRCAMLVSALMTTTALASVFVSSTASAQGSSSSIQIAQMEAERTFDIPAQPLTQALTLFGQQAGLQVTVHGALVRDISVPEVRGTMSSEQALNRLLVGSGLTYTMADDGTVAIQRREQSSGDTAIQLDPVRVGADISPGYRIDRSSSTKSTAPILDTPQTVEIISSAVIEEQGARNLTEVLRNTPGISFHAGENGFAATTNNFNLRGFDASGNVFIDGSRDSGVYSRDTFNVEQVEVIKGAAADNGRGGAGGYVNLVTKTPTLRDFVSGDVSYGFDEYDSDPRRRAVVDVNRVLGDTAAVRLNLMLEDSGVAGRAVAERDAWGIAPSLMYGIGTDARFTLAYEHVESNDVPDFGVPGHTIKGLDLFDPAAEGAPRDAFYGLRSDFDDTVSDAIVGRIEHDFTSNVTISNQTRWARVERDARYTIPSNYNAATQQVSTSTQFYDRVNTTLTNLTNLSVAFTTDSIEHNLSTGFEFTQEKSRSNRAGNVNPGNTDVFNPDPDRFGAADQATSQRNAVEIQTVAAYVYDTAEITEHWEVTGGLRAEQYYVEIESKDIAGNPTGGLDGFEDSKFTLSGKIGVVYKPVRSGSIYASYGVSALPPGSYLSNPDISRTGDNAFPGFVDGAKGVRSHNYEVGTKWLFFGGRLQTSAALFRTEKTNVPITGRDPGETQDSLKGYGKQIVQGLELGVAGNITDELSMFGGIALIDSERKHSAYLDEVRKRASPGDYGPHDRTSGDELSFTPNITANLWVTYRFPIGVTLGGGVQYVGTSYLGRPDDANRIIPNGVFGKLPAFIVFDAMAAYELTENVDLRLNVYNIADDKHAISTNWNGRRATLGGPRTFLLNLGFDF